MKAIWPVLAYWAIGIVVVVVADKTGLAGHQSNPVIFWIGAFLRAWLWPWFLFSALTGL